MIFTERKSIFEVLSDDMDYKQEYNRLFELYKHDYDTFATYINKVFWEWQFRNTCTSPDDMLSKFGFDSKDYRFQYVNQEKYLDLCEIMINFTIIAENGTYKHHRDEALKIGKAISDNIKVSLSKIGYEVYLYKDNSHACIIQSNPEAAAVADIVDETYRFRVMEYNQFHLKGDIEAKRNILKNLADLFESRKNELNNNNLKTLAEDIGFLLNNLNIRHNNANDYPYNQLTKQEIEDLYDKTYQLILTAVLSLERVRISDNVQILKDMKQKHNKGQV